MEYDPAAWLDRFRLDGKVAVVTGASSGLGVAIAQGMAAAGADVAIGARRADLLYRTQELVGALGRRCVAVPIGVTEVDDCRRLVGTAVEQLGSCDVLVNNAGIGGEYHSATEDPPEHFRHVVDAEPHGFGLDEPGRRAGHGGQCRGQPVERDGGDDGADAGGRLQLGEVRHPRPDPRSRRPVGREGHPRQRDPAGRLPDRGDRELQPTYQRKLIDARVPAGRLGDPVEIASTAVFLASQASAYITGAGVPVDGGVLLL